MAIDKKYSIIEVEALAKKLSLEYQNPKFFKWYCGAIYEFGVQEIKDLSNRVSDAKKPGKLFSKIINEQRAANKADEFRRNGYGSEENA